MSNRKGREKRNREPLIQSPGLAWMESNTEFIQAHREEYVLVELKTGKVLLHSSDAQAVEQAGEGAVSVYGNHNVFTFFTGSGWPVM